MSVSDYDELKQHKGHRISCVTYGEENVSLECEDCNEVLIDFDSGEKNGKL